MWKSKRENELTNKDKKYNIKKIFIQEQRVKSDALKNNYIFKLTQCHTL